MALKDLEREVRSLRTELNDLKRECADRSRYQDERLASLLDEHEGAGESATSRRLEEVRVTVTGPRRAGVLVDNQAIALPGEGSQSGRGTIELEPPEVNLKLGVKGRIGTKVTLAVEINGKEQKDSFWTVAEVEERPFRFPFSAFGL